MISYSFVVCRHGGLLLQAGFAFESDLKTLEYVVSGSETQLGVFQYPSILANLERKRT